MSDNKRKKMASKKVKAAEKKAKFKAKMKAALAFVAFGVLCCGCATSEPASRLTRGEYGDITVRLENSHSNYVHVTVGDAAYASADSKGSTETQTANPTNTTDIKPETNVNTTGGRTAGILESMIGAFGAWLATPSGTAAAANAAKSGGACTGGDCSYCPDGNCDTCTDCSP